VAALLSVAGRLAAGPRPARSVLFLAFTGEEFGLLGSSYYVSNPVRPLEKTVAMLNLDMVGRLESGALIVYGTGTAAEWEELIAPAVAAGDVEVAFQDSGYGPSDHTSFYSSDIPVLHFFTNVHGDYHKPSDDVEKIDVAGLERVAALVAGVALRVADRPSGLTLLRTEAPPEAAEEGGYGPYLGTVPDFAPVENGVRLSGVRAGSPAEAAGMQAGDVIVRFGGAEVSDLYAFTDALRARSPGDTVRVVVLRDGQELTLQAVLRER
jgi:membrane-associated protease RseP (regulator of RpoE activity)